MAELYVKKRIPVEAFHWNPTYDNYWPLWHELREFTSAQVRRESALDTEDGVTLYEVYDFLHDTWVKFDEGDWIIKGALGEFYPHNGELFPQVYEPWTDEETT